MEKYEKETSNFQQRRQDLDAENTNLKSYLKELQTLVKQEEEKDESLRDSVKTLDYTEHVIRQAALKYDGELKICRLVRDKLKKLRTKAEQDKREQDFYLDRIIAHCHQMEFMNEAFKRQISAQKQEQDQLNTFTLEAITEVEALQIEKVQLQRAWNDTISVVKARDQAIHAAKETLQ